VFAADYSEWSNRGDAWPHLSRSGASLKAHHCPRRSRAIGPPDDDAGR
jgi:hypothetical protein